MILYMYDLKLIITKKHNDKKMITKRAIFDLIKKKCSLSMHERQQVSDEQNFQAFKWIC